MGCCNKTDFKFVKQHILDLRMYSSGSKSTHPACRKLWVSSLVRHKPNIVVSWCLLVISGALEVEAERTEGSIARSRPPIQDPVSEKVKE